MRVFKKGCIIPIMGTRKVLRGPVADRVAANVKAIRDDRRLTLSDLSERLGRLGRPILNSGLSKIEQGDRRVDVDDLAALALALDVTPNRLMLPAQAGDERINLTPETVATADTAWRWAAGAEAVPDIWADDPKVTSIDRIMRFEHENRPHDPPVDIEMGVFEDHEDVLIPVVEAIQVAVDSGLSKGAVLEYVDFIEAMRALSKSMQARKAKKGKK